MGSRPTPAPARRASRLPLAAALALLGAPPACSSTLSPGSGEPVDTTTRSPLGSVTTAPPMRAARALHTTTGLADGRVLIVGGGSPETPLATAEILDPSTSTTKVIALSVPRLGHTATLLPNGQVLITGGGYGSSAPAAQSAELFDPSTDTFRSTGAMNERRADHAAVLLATGAVLIVGGDVSGVGTAPTGTAELYDPAHGTFTPTGALATPRRPYGAVLLADGRVLLAGGTTTGKRIVASAELYDPVTGRFEPTGDLGVAREKHTAALLPSGRVLVAGGSRGSADSDRLASSELYDPVSGRFTSGPSMRSARHKVTSSLLANGGVLVVGGSDELAEVYEAAANRFAPVAGAAGIERFYPAVTTLADGSVLISGGYTGGGSRAGTWRYRP